MRVAALLLLVAAAPVGAQAPCEGIDPPVAVSAGTVRDHVRTLLEDPAAHARAAAARAIGRASELPPRSDGEPRTTADKDPRSALAAVLRDPSRAVNVAAACALGRHGDGRALGPLEDRRSDASGDLARAIDWAVGRIRERHGTPHGVARP